MRFRVDQRLRLLEISVVVVVGGLALIGCATELPLHPASPPGLLIKTDAGQDAVEIEEKGIMVQLSAMSLLDGTSTPPVYPSAKVDIRITNGSNGSLVLKTKGLSFHIDGAPIALWPYLTFVSPPGKTAEMGDVEEILMLWGSKWHIVLTLKVCPPHPQCVPPPSLERFMLLPNREVSVHIQGLESLQTKDKISLSARFTPSFWDVWRFKLRRLLE